MSIMPDSESEMRRRYSALRTGVAERQPIVVLHISAGESSVASGNGSEAGAVIALDIGAVKTSEDYFRHSPPTPFELENAIMAVEDEVARVRPIIADDALLLTSDATVREIALVAGIRDQPVLILPLETVERTFDRLTAVSLGKPPAHDGLPASTGFAATLLILREFMHHLNFSSLTVHPGERSDAF